MSPRFFQKIRNKVSSFFRRVHNERKTTTTRFVNVRKKQTINDIEPGDIVRLEYKLPVELGFVNPNTLSMCYLNHDEIENTIIQGIVSKTDHDHVTDSKVVEVSYFKQYKDKTGSYLRKMKFIEEEIRWIKVI